MRGTKNTHTIPCDNSYLVMRLQFCLMSIYYRFQSGVFTYIICLELAQTSFAASRSISAALKEASEGGNGGTAIPYVNRQNVNYENTEYHLKHTQTSPELAGVTRTRTSPIIIRLKPAVVFAVRARARTLMRQTRVRVPAAGHGEVRRVPIALSDLRGDGELVVALRQLREGVMAW